ncbi:MAG: sialate O-acetylesterase [Planctomycetota bacterium]
MTGGRATRWAAVATTLLAPLAAQQPTAPRLHALFGDHMVLPQDADVPVRGRAAPGAAIELHAPWLDAPVRGVAGDDGAFGVVLPTPAAGGPHQWSVRAEPGGELVLRDVLVGDVWLGSGQSNMVMPVGTVDTWTLGTVDWERELRDADLPQLRLFTVERRTAVAPLDDVDGRWQVCTAATAREFSAAAFFFGRALQRARGEPLGLCVSAWGGTPCAAWTPAAALAAFPDFAPGLQCAAEAAAGRDPFAAARAAFWKAVAALDPRIDAREPQDIAFDDSDWIAVDQPHRWSDDLTRYDGIGWYRCIVTIPDAWDGRDLLLSLGPIDDMDDVWYGGRRIGGLTEPGRWQEPRDYRLDGRLVAPGPVAIAVRVLDTGGEGGFRGSAEAMRLQPVEGELGALSLSGRWRFTRGAELGQLPPFPVGDVRAPGNPAALWNGMLAPLTSFPFRGVLWYQGESDRQRAERYRSLFPTMIGAWRAAFGRELPFLFVQIAPYGYREGDAAAFELRLAQEQALLLPATAMIATTDVGDAGDIHPRRKRPVGERLALAARGLVYGEGDVAWQAPRPAGCAVEGDALRVQLAPAAGGLRTAPGGPRHFELAGADGAFHPARAELVGDAVVLRSAAVPAPRRARYCHAAAALGDLWNGAGLPAVPFEVAVVD